MRPTRRRRVVMRAVLLGLLAAAAGGVALLLQVPASPERVVLIVIDTLRSDHLSCYGGEHPTPNIDALAQRGQRFTNLVASFHQTSMSMSALFTGRTPSIESGDARKPLFWNGITWCGLTRFADTPDEPCLPGSLPTLAEGMRDAGYWTIGIASNLILHDPSGFSRGFDDWVEVKQPDSAGGSLPDSPHPRAFRYWLPVNRAAIAALDRRSSDRFFLYVHYMDVHDYRIRDKASYAEQVSTADRAVGRLLGYLETAGLLEDTVVIVTSDHGERLGERHALREGGPRRFGHYGNPSFQEVLRVPLIIAPPVDRDPSELLRTEDLFYLIQQIAGVRPGRAPELGPDELFIGEQRFRTYLKGRWKSALRREDGVLHLFDLAADPGETRDVAESHPEVVAAHRRRIEELSQRLGARRVLREELAPVDRERLRALGYLE